MTIQEEKAVLRRQIRAAMRQLPSEEKRAGDARIVAHLLSLEAYRQAETVFCFVSTPREIETRPILLDVLASGRRLCVPRCVEGNRMEAVVIRSLEELQSGAYGILEPPPGGEVLSPEEIGFAVIPCLACDRRGRRLGQGGGYYDRFLARYRGGAALLCREAWVLPAIPADLYDQTIETLVTDAQIYTCRTELL